MPGVPRIIVTTDPDQDFEPAVLYQERVTPTDFESEHASAQLIERLSWAVADATAKVDTAPRR
jgi:hypothetical protein